MPGRKILNESDPRLKMYGRLDLVQRRMILKETLGSLSTAVPSDRYHLLAAKNLGRWQNQARPSHPQEKVQVYSGDWGEVTHMLTKAHGVCFAVLNMANAHVPGGGYMEGMIAQEENMFRRTDCHFQISTSEYDTLKDRYTAEMTDLLQAKNGSVYLDKDKFRVCIRGPEYLSKSDLGYSWLSEDEVFPFFELRASAQDLRGGLRFNPIEARRRIAAQLDTLRDNDVRFAVLSAFGCGAFQNPPEQIARLYAEEITRRSNDFALIAFAIYAPGYGPDNYTPFLKTFEQRDRLI